MPPAPQAPEAAGAALHALALQEASLTLKPQDVALPAWTGLLRGMAVSSRLRSVHLDLDCSREANYGQVGAMNSMTIMVFRCRSGNFGKPCLYPTYM